MKELNKIGHEYEIIELTGFTALVAISKLHGTVVGHYDVRRSGSVFYVHL